MFLQITDCKHLGQYKLRLAFNNGLTKDVNLKEELYGEIFEPLKDVSLFSQVAINPNTNTIEWPNGADFAPEFLDEIGEIVEPDVAPITTA